VSAAAEARLSVLVGGEQTSGAAWSAHFPNVAYLFQTFSAKKLW